MIVETQFMENNDKRPYSANNSNISSELINKPAFAESTANVIDETKLNYEPNNENYSNLYFAYYLIFSFALG